MLFSLLRPFSCWLPALPVGVCSLNFFFLLTFNLVLSNLLLSLFSFIVVFFSFESFLFPYWAVFPAGAFGFLASGSPSWGLQCGM